MWHVYNLISAGDSLTATSFRKVQQTSNTGSTTSQKVLIRLTLDVESIEFDTVTCELRVKGRNIEESEHVKLGQYHTLELALQRNFTLQKQEWDSIHLERIDMACDLKHSAEIGAVIMQPGLAQICLVTTHMTQVRQKIEVAIPRKRVGSTSGQESAMKRFFQSIYDAIKRHLDMSVIKVVLVASPGFLKEDFLKWMFAEALKSADKALLENKSKFMAAQSSSGFKHSLKEVLADPAVSSRVESTKAFSEVRALDAFFDMLSTDPDRAYYGLKHVLFANEQRAIQTLLVTDELFRSSDLNTRRTYVRLVESVKESGGEVKIFSTLHVSGEQLNQLSGVAALLRFPLPEEQVVGEEEEEEGGDGAAGGHAAEDEQVSLYPPSASSSQPPPSLHASSSADTLASHLPHGATSASSASASSSSADPSLSSRKQPSQTESSSSSSSSSKGIIRGFASEHGL